MSPSSSGSWDGAGADIIDLDRYMRGNVKPSRTLSEESEHCEELVVDGGGFARKLPAAASRGKHYSHDSGVSDGSSACRPPRPRRRASNPGGTTRASREPTSARTFSGVDHPRGRSPDSLRAFRAVCEQALLDQQKQIARVSQLCERLTERAENERLAETKGNIERLSAADDTRRPAERARSADKTKRVEKAERVPSETSDISSSSRSTKDLRRKENYRTQECKTYKIIMSKLDELNRRFSAAPRARPSPIPAPRAPRAPSLDSGSGSVSVCDKRVATDPERTVDTIIYPTVRSKIWRDTQDKKPRVLSAASPLCPRVVAQAYSVDIAPREAVVKSPNVAIESVVKCESSGGSSAAGDPRCAFDLEDPVHLYSQAKRLQALNATTRRARSVDTRVHSVADADERSAARCNARDSAARCNARDSAARCNARDSAARCNARASEVRTRSPSLCAVCREYWRSLRRCLAGPFSQDCKCSA